MYILYIYIHIKIVIPVGGYQLLGALRKNTLINTVNLDTQEITLRNSQLDVTLALPQEIC